MLTINHFIYIVCVSPSYLWKVLVVNQHPNQHPHKSTWEESCNNVAPVTPGGSTRYLKRPLFTLRIHLGGAVKWWKPCQKRGLFNKRWIGPSGRFTSSLLQSQSGLHDQWIPMGHPESFLPSLKPWLRRWTQKILQRAICLNKNHIATEPNGNISRRTCFSDPPPCFFDPPPALAPCPRRLRHAVVVVFRLFCSPTSLHCCPLRHS